MAVAAAVCLAGAGLAPAAAAQESGYVYVAVHDRTGQPVTDLTAEEFEVCEEDRPSEQAFCEHGYVGEVVSARIGTEPMKIALLVDNGRGISIEQAINPLRDGVAAFIETIPPEHEISLFTIGGPIVRRTDFTTDRAELLREAGEIFAALDQVRFIDGVRETWDRRYEGDEAWPIFVAILTDANEESAFMNENRFRRFVDSLRAGGVMVHSVLWSANPGSTLTQISTGLAINLAENTGGRYTSIAAATAYGDTLRQLAVDMAAHYDRNRVRYRVNYEPPDPRGSSVTVAVTRSDLNVQVFVDRRMP